jgi:hypothetical protein
MSACKVGPALVYFLWSLARSSWSATWEGGREGEKELKMSEKTRQRARPAKGDGQRGKIGLEEDGSSTGWRGKSPQKHLVRLNALKQVVGRFMGGREEILERTPDSVEFADALTNEGEEEGRRGGERREACGRTLLVARPIRNALEHTFAIPPLPRLLPPSLPPFHLTSVCRSFSIGSIPFRRPATWSST